ncbi:chromate transporter [Facklamia hominis]|uniref:chromate transporter n=1 Tax=Facklamia hominis TaxID=178214 RepID=UPI00101BC77F|nr:chromate transporter [Facklamia hominis]RYC97802.1 chromate transporter [Facklamia hominis]
MIYWQLFLAFIQIGALSFGGGYAALPIIEDLVVNHHGWISGNEFSNLITISQMTPGPIAINAATFVGQQLGGLPGSMVATLGCSLPSIIIVTILAKVYDHYKQLELMQDVLLILRPSVIAMIAASGVSILMNSLGTPGPFQLLSMNFPLLILFILALFLLIKYRLNPILVISISGLLYLFGHVLLACIE